MTLTLAASLKGLYVLVILWFTFNCFRRATPNEKLYGKRFVVFSFRCRYQLRFGLIFFDNFRQFYFGFYRDFGDK
jgi:hypothetical protein